MADDARPPRGGGSRRRAHRGGSRARAWAVRGMQRLVRDPVAAARVVARNFHAARHALPPPRRAELRADGLASVLLQRDLLHVRARAHELLRRRDERRRLLHFSVRGRQLPGAAAARAAVRLGGPTHDDRRHLWNRRVWAPRLGLRVLRRLARRDRDDVVLVGVVLLRVGGRELGLSHGQRDLSARDARCRDLDLLCRRHRRRRVHWARRCTAR